LLELADSPIAEAAPAVRNSWLADFEVFTDGENLIRRQAGAAWTVKKGAPIFYAPGTAYEDRYVCNLFTSSAILEVWGRRKFYENEIWQKIPSSYYTKVLDTTIVTSPGAVTRHVTTLEFEYALSSYECENWFDEVYVSLTSSVTNVVKDLVNWVVTNYTTFTFDATSHSPPMPVNFAYFGVIDAMEFLYQIAWQVASVLTITGTVVKLTYLGTAPGISETEIDTDLVIAKTVEIAYKDIEDINTQIKATYVTDYSGIPDASHSYIAKENESIFGVKSRVDNFWALTCADAVESVSDFWAYRMGNSWKTIKCNAFIEASDFSVYMIGKFMLGVDVVNNVHGLLTTVNHDSASPHVAIEAELAVKAGETTEDSDYWNVGFTSCPDLTIGLSEEDYVVPQDDTCPTWWNIIWLNKELRYIKIVKWPARGVERWREFTLGAIIVDEEGNQVNENTTINQTILELKSPAFRDKTWQTGIAFVAGAWEGQFKVRGTINKLTTVIEFNIISKIKHLRSFRSNRDVAVPLWR
jgi:hypothetical protein